MDLLGPIELLNFHAQCLNVFAQGYSSCHIYGDRLIALTKLGLEAPLNIGDDFFKGTERSDREVCELVNTFPKFVPGRQVTLDHVFNLLCRILFVHVFFETDQAIEFMAWLMTV